ncbi:glycoside hydrolase family 3 N-terminal domain-containing protein [Dictyobacter formicarum]|uniref:glycoside hydrolase family 3 N-terminal domain-containing protein n=1 Tax=Dictyobacter formicarum TaxID=2778368 RepID=UPI0019150159|nr:glycoside hydrolase family 3 N-terminal domain-containing protein [Dictyobacter formicarum]
MTISSTPTRPKLSDIQQKRYQQIATRYVSHMTINEKLGQLFMVSYQTPSYSADLDHMLAQLHAGGVILYQPQINTREQIQQDITKMQQRATLPLLIATDEEGGYVDRLTHIYPPRLSALAIYRTGDPSVAQHMGHQTAHDLLALGINTNLAPDSDVALVNGPDQITRTFGFTTQSVITFAGAYMRALQQDNVIACVKHFPGLGAATTDAHFELPVVHRTKAQIYATELAPFQTFVQSPNVRERPGMVMSTDVLMPAIDPQFPAELSHIFITDILRQQFGYNGVVITDALSMNGISNHWDMLQASIQALKAGNDMIIGINNPIQMALTIAGLKSALQQERLSLTQVDTSVIRILTLKLQYHLLPLELE